MNSSGRAVTAAFLSASDGAGRTSAVANLAWVLASADRRVLVLDLGSGAPRVAEYLEPFATREVALPRPDGAAEPPATARRHEPPGSAGYADVLTEPPAVGGGATSAKAVESRVRLVAAEYDFVLLEAPVGGGAAPAAIAEVADFAVICFVPRQRAIRDAAELADDLRRHASVPLTIVPLATKVNDQDGPRAQRGLASIRVAFAELVDAGDDDATSIRIPYRPYETYEPLLAVVVEEPDDPTGLRAAYEQLAATVSRGSVTRMAPVQRRIRSRYRRVFGIEVATEPDHVVVAYAPRDRAWADWAREALEHAGARTSPLRDDASWPPDAELLIISSSRLDASPVGPRLNRLVAGRSADAVRLRVESGDFGPAAVAPVVDVAGADEPGARARLLKHFGLIEPPDAVDGRPGLPGTEPAVQLLPARHQRFVGREEALEALRDRVVEQGGAVTIGGVPGVGKSELALEYAYRFAGDYDLVWWVPAHDRQAVLIALSQLGDRMRASDLGDHAATEHGTPSPPAELAAGQRFRRWLLVYDNADDTDVLDGLVPAHGPGHVLITSATAEPDLELDQFPVRDSNRLLVARVPGLGDEDAERVARAVEHLPLALELSVSWLAEAVTRERRTGSPVADAVAWSVRAFLERLDEAARPDRGVVARVVAVLVESLAADPAGRIAVLLAQLCSFLSTQGVGLRLVRSTAVVSTLVEVGGVDAGPLRLDSWEVDRVLWLGARHGLFRVDWGERNSLRLHRVVQRALLDAMGPDLRAERQAQALRALAAFAPTEAEEAEESPDGKRSRSWRFRELQKHVFPSGALKSRDEVVRRWLVNQLRFLYTDGGAGVDFASTEPGHELVTSWTAVFGADDALRSRLAVQLANVERRLGRADVAMRLDESALLQQRRTAELTSPQALITARGLGGDLRGLGRFAEALDEDRVTWLGFRDTFGDDHPHTRSAANNLAESLFLSGDPAGALQVEADNFERRLRLFGSRDPNTWWSRLRIGVYQRELGRYAEAMASLRTARDRLRAFGPGIRPVELAAQWHLAIAERLSGNLRSAKERDRGTLRGFREVQGPHHPETLACQLSLAMDHRALGEADTAVELSELVLAGLREHLRLADDHPFTALALLCLGLSRCAAGRVEQGAGEVHRALDALDAKLGEAHPWTLAAAVAHARATAARGDLPGAEALLARAHRDCREYLGDGHPGTVIARDDLRVVRKPGAVRDEGWRSIDVDIPQT
ncbi:FxSxx-COOH system tetratricopeptide repeat protein [Saccharothrix obliqua]|uniref:FxSxx-COOH system tetratricopeptide repeat protein n=1 Tax=Saccharothrix obliqua TaxID=2861747 RepID=UPI001C5CE124|nr:FxSxx-COOH system tetratricopeptide repeat protein [Saccharothrix obliqua]MBW4718174.1 tetratricopeptide repeat protein [Saccharothrix obliqua]